MTSMKNLILKIVYYYTAIITLTFVIQGCQKENNINEYISLFQFTQKENSGILINDVNCEIRNNRISAYIPHTVENKKLIPTISFNAKHIYINSKVFENGKTAIDLSKPAKILIIGHDGEKAEGVICVNAYTGIPIINIYTEDKEDIVSKEEYKKAFFQLMTYDNDCNVNILHESDIKLRCRGNGTYTFKEKLPYRIKFKSPTSLLGFPPHRDYVLLANAFDFTLLKNNIATFIGNLSKLDYTPQGQFIELFLNGVHKGTYQIYEKIEVGSNRVNIQKNDFLLKIDANVNKKHKSLKVNTINSPIMILEPKDINDKDIEYIIEYFNKTITSIYGNHFKDINNGYTKYIDIMSFIDWYIINEIAHNNDACFYKSCYMQLARGKKLKMGPIWDFDTSFGWKVFDSYKYDEESYKEMYVINTTWYRRLFEDKSFAEKVYERYLHFYKHKSDIIENIDYNYNYLRYSIKEMNNIWFERDYEQLTHDEILQLYKDEVQELKNYVSKRMDFLKLELENISKFGYIPKSI